MRTACPRDPARAALALLAALAVAGPAAAQSYLDDVGYTALRDRLGAATPTGAGVPVAQVEAPVSTSPLVYAPDPNAFIANLPTTRPSFSITYNPALGSPPQYSGHANMVGNLFYGDGSMAQSVTNVQAWEANTWINSVLAPGPVPDTTWQPKVSNHSYIGTLDQNFTAADADDLTRRADYLVNQTGHIMVVAVGNNGRTNPSEPAPVFGNIYNGIVVGRSDGQDQTGFTTISGSGRVKPDLVAPAGTTSEATPIVAAAATILVQAAGSDQLASRPETIKAALMAGAIKDAAAFTTPWSRTPTRPLDPVYGAGQLNINNSHLILTAGRQPASAASTVAATGWDLNTINPVLGVREQRYFFDVPAGQALSAVLTWERQFRPGSLDPTLANLDLHLYRTDGAFTLVGTPLDESVSTVDNVEHIWVGSGLDAGRYALVVDTAGSDATDYALAWQTRLAPVPEPGSVVAVAAAGLLGVPLLRRAQRAAASAFSARAVSASSDPAPSTHSPPPARISTDTARNAV